MLFYMKIFKSLQESPEADLVLLLLNVLFQGCMENDEWKLGETASDIALELVPNS